MSRSCTALLLLLLSLASLCLSRPQQQSPQYTQKYDNFDPDSLVRNERILLSYYKCVMDQGPCTKDGKLFKRVLPEALKSSCSFCTAKQTLLVRKLLIGIYERSEPRFNELISKFDGGGAYHDRINNFIFGTTDDDDST